MATLKTLLKPEQIPLGAKVTRNVVYNGLRLFLLAPLPLLVIPFYLKKLGTSGYGTWAMFLAVNGMTSLADLGLVTALSKHVAEFYAHKDIPSLGRIISTGIVLYLGIGAMVAAFLWLSSPYLLPILFRSSPTPKRELEILWHDLILLVVANTLSLMFSSIVVGLQRMDLSTTITACNVLANAGLSVLFLSWNWGIRGMLYAYVLAAWLACLAYVYVVYRLLPEVRFNLRDCQWSLAKEILGFGLTTYITTIAVTIHNQIEKFYLARFVGVVPVGWYDISSDLALKLRGIPSLILTPVMPASSELHALSDQYRLVHLYHRAHKYLACIGIPLVVFVVFVSKRFVELWVGPALGVIALPLSVLFVANFINLATGPGFLILVGGGKLRPGLYSATLAIVVNVAMSFFLIKAYGFQGAVIGTAFSLIVGSTFFLYLFRREMNGFSGVIRRAYMKPLISSLASVSFLWMLPNAGLASWHGLAIQGLIFGLTYLGLLLLLRFFDSFDLAVIERYLPIPRMARRLVPDAELGGALFSNSKGD